MYSIAIRCEKAGIGSSCGYELLETADLAVAEALDQATKRLVEKGWIERDGKHYCPRHNPDLTGELVHISLEYVEVAPGVRVRWPGAQQEGDGYHIEVQRVTVQENGSMTEPAAIEEPQYEMHEWAVEWPTFSGPERQTYATEVEAREILHAYGPTAYITKIEPVRVDF